MWIRRYPVGHLGTKHEHALTGWAHNWRTETCVWWGCTWNFLCYMDLVYHRVDQPPPNNPYGAWAPPRHEVSHIPFFLEVPRANIFQGKLDHWPFFLDNGADIIHNIRDAGLLSPACVFEGRERIFCCGSLASKISNLETKCHHSTTLGAACPSVANGLSPDAIFLCHEEETSKVVPGTCVRVCRGCV